MPMIIPASRFRARVAALQHERLARPLLRQALGLRAQVLDLERRQRLAQPRQVVERHRRAGQVRDGPDVGVIADQRHVLVVDGAVPDRVGEAVDARPDQVLGVGQPAGRAEVRRHPHAAGVRLVDDRPVDLRPQLRHRAAPVVDPDLDDVYPVTVQFLDRRATLRRGLRATRDPEPVLLLRSGHRCGGDPAPGRQEACRVGEHRVPQLEGQRLVELQPQAHRGCHAVIGGPLQMFDQVAQRVVVLAVRAVLHVREPDVLVGVDQGRDYRLSGQVHAFRALGGLPLALATDPGEDAVLDEECRPLDRRAAVPVDEPGALEPRSVSRRLLGVRGDARDAEQRGGADVTVPAPRRGASRTQNREQANSHPTRPRGARPCHGERFGIRHRCTSIRRARCAPDTRSTALARADLIVWHRHVLRHTGAGPHRARCL